jgi:hypothetical protein
MNRWYFWVLAPIFLTTALGMPLIVEPPTTAGWVVLYVFSATLIFATLGLAAPRRFAWSLRLVAAAVLAAYLAYATSEITQWWNGQPAGLQSGQSDANLLNALKGLIVFGLPSLYFLLRGRSDTVADTLVGDDADDDEQLT